MKKEKQFIAVAMLTGLILLGAGYLLGKEEGRVQNIFPPNYHTEDTSPVKDNPKSINITFIDSVDGRPTFFVEFPDSTKLDSMYPEEIAHGLTTGNWSYNEDLEIKEKAY